MDRPIDPATTHQAGVGCIDNGIGALPGDVTLKQGKSGHVD
jgi:hypothetical protein